MDVDLSLVFVHGKKELLVHARDIYHGGDLLSTIEFNCPDHAPQLR